MSELRSYPKVWNLGHKATEGIFQEEVEVQEKVDGSQFSFGVVDGVWRFRSKRKAIFPDGGVPNLFEPAVSYIMQNLAERDFPEGWVFRGEALWRPKHNTLSYSRAPEAGFVLFDIMIGDQKWLTLEKLSEQAQRMGVEVVPNLFTGKVSSRKQLEDFLERESFLGREKVEGVVIKNYSRFDPYGHTLMAKIVREDFRERNSGKRSASKADIVARIVEAVSNEARWRKTVERRRDSGELEGSPRDIGPMIKDLQNDIREEEEEWIKEQLFKEYWNSIRGRAVRGFPEWYKRSLVDNVSFNEGEENGQG